MKPKRVDCCNCQNFDFDKYQEKFFCKLGKRVMFRVPSSPYAIDFLFPRYCNDFKQIENI